MPVLTIQTENGARSIRFEGAPKLNDVLAAHGYGMLQPCGGAGRCGKCAVEAFGALSPLTQAERAAGSRLACQTVLKGDCTVVLPKRGKAAGMLANGMKEQARLCFARPMQGRLGAAVDIGTTTLALALFDLASGACLARAAAVNPQTQFAADVIGRIEAALNGKLTPLCEMVRSAVQALLAQTYREAGVFRAASSLVVTGNTAMLYLLAGKSPQSLCRAPFQADCLFGYTECFGDQTVYLPPCMASFAGADITCAVLATGMCDSSHTALLVDVGTNGEMALWHGGKLYVTSTAAGPVFEGAGIACGCIGSVGAIDRVSVSGNGLAVHTIGDETATGICGSGLIDAVAALLMLDEIDETGAAEADKYVLKDGIYLAAQDIRNVQLAKAAVAAGIETLLTHAGSDIAEVATVYLAGSFGSRIRLQSAARIGLIPGQWQGRVRVVGNAALDGACMLLGDRRLQPKAAAVCAGAEIVQLAGNALFSENYIKHMLFDENAFDA